MIFQIFETKLNEALNFVLIGVRINISIASHGFLIQKLIPPPAILVILSNKQLRTAGSVLQPYNDALAQLKQEMSVLADTASQLSSKKN